MPVPVWAGGIHILYMLYLVGDSRELIDVSHVLAEIRVLPKHALVELEANVVNVVESTTATSMGQLERRNLIADLN